jgi:peptidyl-prolyl cis-trans isomerase SurA
MVPSFEDAVFTMKSGELTSTPIRTTYGLHIVKVFDRKPSSGEIRCSHIMIRFNKQEPAPEDTLAAYRKIAAIQDSLMKGTDFAELAKRNSEDPGSSGQGGDLNWFSRGRWVLPFDEIAFSLKPGQVSGIVRTAYGYHLIKCYDARPLKPFDEMKKELQPVYQQQRFQDDYQKYLSRLKQELKFTLHDSVLAQFIAGLDSNKSTKDSTWATRALSGVGRQTVMSFGGRPISVDSAVALISGRTDLNNTPLRPSAVRSAFDKVSEQLAFAIKGESLERQDSAFAQIMKDYTEGILLYQVEQDQVWTRVAVSDSASKAYFNTHRERFRYPDRVRFSEIRAANDSLAKLISGRLAKGESFEDIVAADSARMRSPSNTIIAFAKNSTKIPVRSQKELEKLSQDLKSDAALKLNVTMRPDTTGKKMAKLTSARLDTIRSLLVKRFGVPDSRITTVSQLPTKAPSKMTKAEKDSVNSTAHIMLVGRVAIVQGRVVTELLSAAADERARRADSLSIGQFSKPFEYKRSFSIVRLDGREAAREKTYEEAGTEASSALQEYELKRLETEWLDGLKKSHPVVEHPEVLKNAFVSAR